MTPVEHTALIVGGLALECLAALWFGLTCGYINENAGKAWAWAWGVGCLFVVALAFLVGWSWA
jgi:hypothetical protein